MKKEKQKSRELTELCARVSQWRKDKGGGRGCPIPEALWQEAARVARLDGVFRTARALGFNYQRLQARSLDASETRDASPTAPAPPAPPTPVLRSCPKKGKHPSRIDLPSTGAPEGSRFVAIPMTPPRTNRSGTVELWGPTGERMRVEVVGDLDVAQLAQMFWRRS